MATFVKVAELHQVPPGRSRTVWVNGRSVALHNVDGDIFATADACPHEGVSLGTGGALDGDVITCGYHFWSFNVQTGDSADGMEERLETFPVRVVGNEICIQPPRPLPCSRGSRDDGE